MKKIFILLILFYAELYALERDSTIKMYQSVFTALTSKLLVSVYTNDKEYKDVFKYSKQIILSKKLEDADIVLITEERTLKSVLKKVKVSKSKMPVLFVTQYKFLKYSENILGASYWRKGRPQLLFIKKRLDKHFIVLPREYRDFTIDEL